MPNIVACKMKYQYCRFFAEKINVSKALIMHVTSKYLKYVTELTYQLKKGSFNNKAILN